MMSAAFPTTITSSGLLVGSGHTVLGAARSDDGARALAARGIEVLRGHLTEPQTLADAARSCDGVRTAVIRLPPTVYSKDDRGFTPRLIDAARQSGVAAYIGDGANRWPAVHRLDAARFYRLALEKGSPGARYHAVGDEGVATRDIAEAIGRHLNLPIESIAAEKAGEHFGFLGMFFGIDAPASAGATRAELGWAPREPGLLAGLATDAYYAGGSKY